VIKRLLLALAAAVLTLGWVWTAPSAQATTFTACEGVWVVVDYGTLGGGVDTKCATSFSTGTNALRNAGFSPILEAGMVTQISAKPAKPVIDKAYWSYWQATRKTDGSYSGWSYSNSGSNAYHPTKGNAEGWHYVSLSEAASGPGSKPPNNPAVKAVATPSATKASASSKASASASASSKPSASASTSATPTPTPAAADTQSSTPQPTVVSSPDPSAPTGGSSPLPLIITSTVVVGGGAGAGAWWLWRGRRR